MKYARALPAVALLVLASGPDEGQWLPQQILAKDWKELRARGMELTKDQFWHPDKGGVLSAAVQLGGCSASFVSPDGLVVTNHHCAFGALTRQSTVEKNYASDGFVAASRAEEIPDPNTVVYVVRRIRDVTEEIHAAQAKAETDLERWHATKRAERELIAEGQKEPNTTCHVASFLEGQQYHLYYRTQIRDVRIVYAPPRSVGEFGGDIDNWEWPRHTGDFTFLRAYVAPDGTSRAHHPDNVPYKPKHYLRVSGKGVQADDLVLILGYPGRTERYLTSVAVQDRQTVTFPTRLDVFTKIIKVFEKAGEKDERRALAYSSLIKSLANSQKNALGMVKGLARNAVVERKVREERAFEGWANADAGRKKEFGSALQDMLSLDLDARKTAAKDVLVPWMQAGAFLPFMGAMIRAIDEVRAAKSSGVDPAGIARRLGSPRATSGWDELQRPNLDILLDAARSLPEDQRIRGTEFLTASADDVPTAEVVAQMLSASRMLDADARVALFEKGADAVEESSDPLVILARGLGAELAARSRRNDARAGRKLVVGQRWIEAQQKWRGTSFYPDANSTLRVSVASVKAYSPRDGVMHTPHTTVAGVVAKETGAEPFKSPTALLEAAARRNDSKFFDGRIGDVPVCFLSDGDTTGGNSGSPVINGRGELVGLNFDRVFENVSGDFGWGAERSRNISVDIRYVLWIVESVKPAPHLLKELGV